jgi:hypothetical protein
MAERTKTTVYVESQLLKDFQKTCIDRDLSQTDAFEQCIRNWLAGPELLQAEKPGELTPEMQKLVSQFTAFMQYKGTELEAKIQEMVREIVRANARQRAQEGSRTRTA